MPNRLRQVRERKGFTQAELARAVGVTRQALHAVESAKQEPGLQVALTIARVLDTTLEQIFSSEAAMEKVATRYLTKPERLILVNQYKILQAVHSKEEYLVKHYRRLEEIFERGYIGLYSQALGELGDELPHEESDEVLSILDLHRAMLWSLGPNSNPKEVERVKFQGFDGNNESKHLGFAKFFTQDDGKYSELKIFNSHCITLPRYRRMLAEWERMGRNPHLTKQQIDSVLEAGTFRH